MPSLRVNDVITKLNFFPVFAQISTDCLTKAIRPLGSITSNQNQDQTIEIGVKGSLNGCLFLRVGTATGWRPDQGVPRLSPWWYRLQPLPTCIDCKCTHSFFMHSLYSRIPVASICFLNSLQFATDLLCV